MIEAGARALCEAEGVRWKELTDGEVDWYMRDSRAVLTAALAVAPTQDEGGDVKRAIVTAMNQVEMDHDYDSGDIPSNEEYADAILAALAALAAPASASRSEVVKKVLAEVHGQDPNRTYPVGEVKRLVYALTDIAPASAEPEPCGERIGLNGICPCELPTGHEGMHECRNHRFSDRPLWDGSVPAEPTPVSRDEELIAEAKAHDFWSIKNDAGKTLGLIYRLVEAYEEATK